MAAESPASSVSDAIARVVYRMLKYQVEYETINVNEYEKKYEPSAASEVFEKESGEVGLPTRPRRACLK